MNLDCFDHEMVSETLRVAKDDYESALFLSENKHPRPLEIVCFHCQQSIEKYLKVILMCKGVALHKTHDLVVLVAMVRNTGIDIPETFEMKASYLQPFAVEARYPTKKDDIQPHHADRALKYTTELIEFLNPIIETCKP